MSVQIVSDPQPTVPSLVLAKAFWPRRPTEKVAAIDGYYAYYGTWSVNESGSSVTHHIRESLYPANVVTKPFECLLWRVIA